MADLVAHMGPKPKAVVSREVGGFRMRIGVDLGKGRLQYVDIGIQLAGAPFEDIEDNPVAAFRIRQSVERALTDDIQVRYGKGARVEESVKFADLLADVIIHKARNTL